MARPFPTKESTLREIILYILEERGPIGDDDNSMRLAAQMLEEGTQPGAKSFAINYMKGKRPQTTRKEIENSRWMTNLRRASYSRLMQCKDLIEDQLKQMEPDKQSKKFTLPENFEETVLAMIGGKENMQSVASKMGITVAALRDYAVRGKITITRDHIERFIPALEAAVPEENSFLAPLLRVYAEKHMTVSQAKAVKKVNKELFRQVAREILVDMRQHFGLSQDELQKRIKDAYAGKYQTDERVPKRISVAVVTTTDGKVAAFENGDKMSASGFADCISAISNVLHLERNNPKKAKLLSALANAIR